MSIEKERERLKEDLIEAIFYLHRQGWSNADIGRRLKYDGANPGAAVGEVLNNGAVFGPVTS